MLRHPKDSNLSVPTMDKVGDYFVIRPSVSELLKDLMKSIIVPILKTKTKASTPYKVLVTILGKASWIEVPDCSSSRSIFFLKRNVQITKTNDNASRLG